ncbi:hypothetical protein R83H12_01193 [Fibrobacteria bacterium R8-3-H12]
MKNKAVSKHYDTLISQIGDLLQQGRKQAAYAVNNILVQTYWQIGKYIVEYEQGGSKKSEYGSKLLDHLSKDLTLAYGKGFSRSNLMYIRKLYISFQISETVSHQFKKPILSTKLSWSHYFEILKADNEPIGIVLGTYKDKIMVEYAIDNITNNLFVSKYQLYLPNKEELEKELTRLIE